MNPRIGGDLVFECPKARARSLFEKLNSMFWGKNAKSFRYLKRRFCTLLIRLLWGWGFPLYKVSTFILGTTWNFWGTNTQISDGWQGLGWSKSRCGPFGCLPNTLKPCPWKRRVLLDTIIIRFHVKIWVEGWKTRSRREHNIKQWFVLNYSQGLRDRILFLKRSQIECSKSVTDRIFLT